MEKRYLPLTLLLSIVLPGSGPAQGATTSTTLDITAIVGNTCSVSTSPLVFNVIDQAVDTFASGSITVTCNTGMLFDIALDAGLNYDTLTGWRGVTDGLGNRLEYDLGSNFYGQPWGDGNITHWAPVISATATGGADVFTVDGILFGLQFKPDGLYSDVVTVTVTY